MNHDHVGLPDGDEAPIQSKQTIASPKRMVTVFWSPIRSSGVEILPIGQHFDAQYFTLTILSVIAEHRGMQTWEDQNRKIVLYFDNASPHTARSTIGYMNRNYRVTHIRCSITHHERGCVAHPRREQGKATLRRLAAIKIG
jgi:hypothetical protein